MGEQSTLLLGSRRIHPERALAAGYQFREVDLERSLRRALNR
jgi:NAD dependent epimerase/dehydratase family enzyme